MRLGIFGGSFDPPHVGHLLVAQDAVTALSLDLLLIIPAATQPLKTQHSTAAAHRLAMTRRCFADIPGMVVDPVEIERGGLSFMVDTVEHVRGRYPGAALHLLVGDDVIPTLPRWHQAERLLTLVELVVLHRVLEGTDAASDPPNRFRQLATRRVDVSSTEVRSRARDGRSIRGFVPDAVADYIASTGLYLPESTTGASARA